MRKILLLLFIASISFSKAQTYIVSSIPYNPFPFSSGDTIPIGQDDIWTDTLPIGFSFYFFGQPHDSIVAGANSILSFNLAYANLHCPWNLTDSSGIPNPILPVNTIMLPFQDLDISIAGFITKKLIGTPPNRKFVIAYNSVPFFSIPCNNLKFTGEVVLNEGSNDIDIFIHHKDTCSSWNSGLAILGIQNNSGTAAFTVAGRNSTKWIAQDEGWRFTTSPTTGVKSFSNALLKVYPNPANDFITIQTPTPASIKLMDISGRVFIEKNVLETKSEIDISMIPKGIYFLSVGNDGSNETIKLIRQ